MRLAVSLVALYAGLFASGCSGPYTATATNPSVATKSFESQSEARQAVFRARDGFTYVSEFYSPVINLYRTNNERNAPPVCSIREVNEVQGMKTDASGTLYVSYYDGAEKEGVRSYAPHCGRAERTFIDLAGTADDIAIDGNKLYVSDSIDAGQTAATLEVYSMNGSSPVSNPIRDLNGPSTRRGIGVVVDSEHNVFWSTTTMTWTVGRVIEYPKGKQPGTVLTAMSIGNDFPGGLVIDHKNDLGLVNQTHPGVSVFAPPYTGKAIATFPLKGTTVYCALGHQDARIYCLDYQFGAVDVYTFPKGAYLFSYTNGIESSEAPEGIAIEETPGSL